MICSNLLEDFWHVKYIFFQIYGVGSKFKLYFSQGIGYIKNEDIDFICGCIVPCGVSCCQGRKKGER